MRALVSNTVSAKLDFNVESRRTVILGPNLTVVLRNGRGSFARSDLNRSGRQVTIAQGIYDYFIVVPDDI